MSKLKIEGLKKNYPYFGLDISFETDDSELVVLLGPSGSGKSTILRLIAGIEQKDSGRISLGGNTISSLPPQERRVGMVFQDYALFPHLDVEHNISFGLEARGASKEEIIFRVAEMLELVGMGGYGGRNIDSLSGGERQRVAIARAIAPSPDILLMDEPLSALDRSLREGLRREIRRIQRDTGITTVYVTHDQEEALSLADRIVILRDGRVEQEGTPADVYERPANRWCAEFFGGWNLVPARTVGLLLSKVATNIDVLVRQDDILLEGPVDDGPGTVIDVLYHGSYSLVYVTFDESIFVIKAREPDVLPGDIVKLSVLKYRPA